MTWIYIDLKVQIVAEAPLHIGTGFDRGLTQRTVVRERIRTGGGRHQVYIPGTSLKGKVRNACENLARAADLPVCRAPDPRRMCPNGTRGCLVCRIFGAPGDNRPAGRCLHWDDAHLLPAWEEEVQKWAAAQTVERTQVQMSRILGTAAQDRLYTSEFAAPDLAFEGRISGWLEGTPCLEGGYYEINLLVAGITVVKTLGGGRTRGAGHCRITLPDEIRWKATGEQEATVKPLAKVLKAAGSVGLFEEEREGAV